MWESITRDKYELGWIVHGIKDVTLIWVTDGFYDRKRVPTISDADWLVHWTRTQKMLKGSFFEVSLHASLYRGKLLGLCSMYLFALTLEEFFAVEGWTAKVCCNNERVLDQASRDRLQV